MAASKAFCGVLIDLSGTVHVGEELITNAKNGLLRLQKANISYRFVTNTTKESKDLLVKRLKRLRLDVHDSQIFTSLSAAKHYVTENKLKPHLMLHDDALSEFSEIQTNGKPDAILIGLAPDKFDYSSLNQAFSYILDGASLIAIHKARYYKRSDGLALGPGPFISALEYATGKKAVVIGKPEKEFFQSAVKSMHRQENATYFMIGDDVKDDIDGAQKAGMLGILVKTGKYRQNDESTINPAPYRTVDSLADAVEIIIEYEAGLKIPS